MFRFGDPGGRIYTSVGTSLVNLLAHWSGNVYGNTPTWSVAGSAGRVTGSCLRLNSTNNNQTASLYKTLSDSQATLGVAFAFKVNPLFAGGTAVILQFIDVGSLQCDLRVTTGGNLLVTRNGTTLGTVTSAVTANTWMHIELKITFHPSAGTVELWVNGVQQLNLTSQNTRTTANSTANGISIGLINQNTVSNISTNIDFDDFIVYDAQTTDANGFTDIVGPIGDCNLTWLLPSGAGTTTQFTPDSGSNYARVNEATPDGDTSYVQSSTVNQIDTYALTDLPTGVVTIKSLALVHYVNKTYSGSRGIKAELRSAGANFAHTTEFSLSNTYQYLFSNFGQDPNNGSATTWLTAAVNALEIGQKVSS